MVTNIAATFAQMPEPYSKEVSYRENWTHLDVGGRRFYRNCVRCRHIGSNLHIWVYDIEYVDDVETNKRAQQVLAELKRREPKVWEAINEALRSADEEVGRLEEVHILKDKLVVPFESCVFTKVEYEPRGT